MMMGLISVEIRHRCSGMRFITVQRQKLALSRVRKALCDSASLSKEIDHDKLKEIFLSPQVNEEWPRIERESASWKITDTADGVNLGDRRALYYLVRYLRPRSILEIGTNIGASTVHIAAALQRNHGQGIGNPFRLTTVDILDVNDLTSQSWLGQGATYSPKEILTSIGAAECTTFITGFSLEYLANCKDSYDVVFLDGDHSAKTVYQEIPLALRVLNQGGVILLHDYFPDLRPLWTNGAVIPGPWLGTQRLKSEGQKIKVLPLGELPWKTKFNSNVTSLALLIGA